MAAPGRLRCSRFAIHELRLPPMDVAALILYVVFVALTVGVRVAIQVRRTGSTGFHRFRGEPGSAEWWAGILFLLGVVLAPLAPLLALLGVLEPIPALDGSVGHTVGLILTVAGILAVFLAQLAMGDSWRVGVEPEERTELVVSGPFAIVRNPIFALTIPMAIGFALMVPSVLALIALVLVVVSLELLVRAVEEPYLLRVHGAAYRNYAARVGRFLPGVGRLDPSR
jgi:protein-S-isoprenylcysteine O-methyltransferase Ste14